MTSKMSVSGTGVGSRRTSPRPPFVSVASVTLAAMRAAFPTSSSLAASASSSKFTSSPLSVSIDSSLDASPSQTTVTSPTGSIGSPTNANSLDVQTAPSATTIATTAVSSSSATNEQHTHDLQLLTRASEYRLSSQKEFYESALTTLRNEMEQKLHQKELELTETKAALRTSVNGAKYLEDQHATALTKTVNDLTDKYDARLYDLYVKLDKKDEEMKKEKEKWREEEEEMRKEKDREMDEMKSTHTSLINELQLELTSLRRTLSDNTTSYEETLNQTEDEHTLQILSLSKSRDDISRKVTESTAILQAEISAAQRKLIETRNQTRILDVSGKEKEEQMRHLASVIRKLTQELTALKHQLRSKEESITRRQHELARARQDNGTLKNFLEILEHRIAELEKRENPALETMLSLRKQVESMSQELYELNRLKLSIQQSAHQKQGELTRCQQSNQNLRTKLTQNEVKFTNLTKEFSYILSHLGKQSWNSDIPFSKNNNTYLSREGENNNMREGPQVSVNVQQELREVWRRYFETEGEGEGERKKKEERDREEEERRKKSKKKKNKGKHGGEEDESSSSSPSTSHTTSHNSIHTTTQEHHTLLTKLEHESVRQRNFLEKNLSRLKSTQQSLIARTKNETQKSLTQNINFLYEVNRLREENQRLFQRCGLYRSMAMLAGGSVVKKLELIEAQDEEEWKMSIGGKKGGGGVGGGRNSSNNSSSNNSLSNTQKLEEHKEVGSGDTSSTTTSRQHTKRQLLKSSSSSSSSTTVLNAVTPQKRLGLSHSSFPLPTTQGMMKQDKHSYSSPALIPVTSGGDGDMNEFDHSDVEEEEDELITGEHIHSNNYSTSTQQQQHKFKSLHHQQQHVYDTNPHLYRGTNRSQSETEYLRYHTSELERQLEECKQQMNLQDLAMQTMKEGQKSAMGGGKRESGTIGTTTWQMQKKMMQEKLVDVVDTASENESQHPSHQQQEEKHESDDSSEVDEYPMSTLASETQQTTATHSFATPFISNSSSAHFNSSPNVRKKDRPINRGRLHPLKQPGSSIAGAIQQQQQQRASTPPSSSAGASFVVTITDTSVEGGEQQTTTLLGGKNDAEVREEPAPVLATAATTLHPRGTRAK